MYIVDEWRKKHEEMIKHAERIHIYKHTGILSMIYCDTK